MKLILYLSDYMIPLIMLYMVGFGILMKRPVYDDFVRGAKEGARTVAGILPTLVGLMVGVGVLRASGFLDALSHGLEGGISGPAASRNPGEAVFFQRCHRTGAGHFPAVRSRLGAGDDHISDAQLYGNSLLYYEHLFSVSRSKEDQVHASGSPPCHHDRSFYEHYSGKMA